MAVVMIVGILATLATYGVRKYVRSSKTGEAISVIGDIKSAQEAYRAETFRYLNVSSSIDSYYPNANPGQSKTQWGASAGDGANFRALGVMVDGAVLWGYASVAGTVGDAWPVMTDMNVDAAGLGLPAAPDAPFYFVVAAADMDGNGTRAYAISHNRTGEIRLENEGE